MISASIYIIEHFLFNEPQTINFGGRRAYNFILNDEKTEIELTTEENSGDIINFFGSKISNISAIVGANGTGKTSIMSIINKYKDDTKAVFVFDDGSDLPVIENRTGDINDNGNPTNKNQIKVNYNSKELDYITEDNIPKLYYTSIPDIELDNFMSALDVSPQRNQTLDDYHFDKIEKNVMFLSSDLSVVLKNKNKEIPIYEKLFISAKPLSKRDLRNTYTGFVKEGEIETIQKEQLENLWDTYKIKIKIT